MTPIPPPARPPLEIKVIDDRFTILRHAVEAVAIVAAGVWAFYTFVYQERIKPANEPAALAPSIAVRRIGRDATREFLEVSARLRNTGKTEIDLAADAYNVWGDTYARRQSTREHSLLNDRRFFRGLALRSHALVLTMAELRDRAIDGRRGTHIIIEAGAEETLSEVFVVPRGAYDAIHAQVFAVPVKADATRVLVTIARARDGSSWLRAGPGVEEDDLSSDFALVP